MQTCRHAFLHQGVIGRMEIDAVNPVAACVDDAQARRILIGQPTELHRLR